SVSCLSPVSLSLALSVRVCLSLSLSLRLSVSVCIRLFVCSCKQIWLGLYDDRTASIPDFREPQKVKEFLQEKYEKKRWFVPPDQAKVVASVHASISGSSASSTSSTPEVRPLKTLLGESAPTLHLNKHTPSQSPVGSRAAQALQLSQPQQFHDKKFDLLSDLGGDIFAAPPHSQTAAGSAANFANFAHFNSQPAAQNANADFANFDAFGSATVGPSGAFPSAPHAPFQTSHTGRQFNANSALADLDTILSSVPSGVPGSLPPGASAGLRHPQSQLTGTSAADRYAALAELDNVFGSSAPATSVYNTISTSQGYENTPSDEFTLFPLPSSMSTNPFAAAAVAPATATTNPFQSNGRAAAVAAAATFGTGSMSMPAGFGNAATYNLPTSFSGTFQPPFPGQAPFPQPPAYPQQPNGGFSAYGQAKAVVTPFGQAMAAPGVSSNPFLFH
uniref:ArfGAP with FG repeats 1a n=1 Tax=Hucho hucho TaxID=62062 RepID=A0A4W5PVN1_9TELE